MGEPEAPLEYIKTNSSIEGKYQSVYPPSVELAHKSAAIPEVVHPLKIRFVLFSPVPIVKPVPPMVVNKQPQSAVPSSFGAATIPLPFVVSK